jgi:hypothetical protein
MERGAAFGFRLVHCCFVCALFCALVFSLVVLAPRTAHAQRARGRFEPTDLRLQPSGVSEIDLQAGYVTGEDGKRVFAPDYEASIGITSHTELELDGTYGLDSHGKPAALDNTLLALRIEMFDIPDALGSRSAWSGGVQAGARLPTLPGAHRLGSEALFIVGRTAGRMHLFGQVGAIVDSAQSMVGTPTYRPFGIESGLDLDLDLDDQDLWSFEAELGAVQFFSSDRNQVHLTAGPALNVAKALQLSVVGLVGFLAGGDRAGVLLGATTHFKVF